MRRRMSRKERARRRRIITITVTAVVAVVIIVAAALIKSCAGKKNTDASDNNAISETTQNVNNNSNNSVSSTQAESTENKSTEAATDNASDGKEKTSKGFTIETRNGATYIDGYLIANKTYALPSTFIPENPEVPVTEARSNTSLDKDLMTAFRKCRQMQQRRDLTYILPADTVHMIIRFHCTTDMLPMTEKRQQIHILQDQVTLNTRQDCALTLTL